jgi:SAM-dependent methyltransferase
MLGFRYSSESRENVGEELRAAWIHCLHYQLGWPMEAALARTLEEERRTHAKRLLRTLANERGWTVQGASVLDVGAGAGALLIELLHNGARALGVEPGFDYATLVRRRVAAENLDSQCIIDASGEAVPFFNDTFDYVISRQVLEHVPDPGTVIRELFRVLKPGGRCYLSCENYLAFREQEYGVAWLPLLPKSVGAHYLRLRGRDPAFLMEHVHYTTYPQILRLCREAGFVNQTYKKYRSRIIRGLRHATNFFKVGVRFHLLKPSGNRML